MLKWTDTDQVRLREMGSITHLCYLRETSSNTNHEHTSVHPALDLRSKRRLSRPECDAILSLVSWLRLMPFMSELAGLSPTLVKVSKRQTFCSPSLVNVQCCRESQWHWCSVLGIRPPVLEFRILCREGSVIWFIAPSSGCSSGPVQPMCAQRWHTA